MAPPFPIPISMSEAEVTVIEVPLTCPTQHRTHLPLKVLNQAQLEPS